MYSTNFKYSLKNCRSVPVFRVKQTFCNNDTFLRQLCIHLIFSCLFTKIAYVMKSFYMLNVMVVLIVNSKPFHRRNPRQNCIRRSKYTLFAQETIARESEQLPCTPVTSFSPTSLFLEQFWRKFKWYLLCPTKQSAKPRALTMVFFTF